MSKYWRYFIEYINIYTVYSIEGLNIILFQHRSPIIEGKGKTYVDQLSSFIINSRFSKVIIIGGLDSSVQNVEMIGKYLYSNIIISNSQNVMYLSTSNEELPVMNYTGIIINDKSEIQLQVYIYIYIHLEEWYTSK